MTGPRRVRIEEGWATDDYGRTYPTETLVADPDGDLVTSRLADEVHLPLIDLDLPVALTPSKTPGHSHLVIDCPMTWRRYKRLLRALVRAGLVEKSWYRLVRSRRQALLAVTDDG